nr:MAG TPA: hypothetical protein [Caudoviricetes sp.]
MRTSVGCLTVKIKNKFKLLHVSLNFLVKFFVGPSGRS